MVIDMFRGKYWFLSNLYEVPITFDGVSYPSVEHAYQCQKTFDQSERNKMLYLSDGVTFTPPNICKQISKNIKIRRDWEDVKCDIMYRCLVEKFSHPYLANLLLQTGEVQLIEGNWWGDTYWGICKGKGQNKLGKMLMSIRGLLNEAK